MASGKNFRPIWCLLTAIWASVVGVGLCLVLFYKSVPGAVGDVPANWPVESSLRLDDRHATLILFVHPRCPCTMASLSELEQIIARCHSRVSVHVMFWTPPGEDPEWTQAPSRLFAEGMADVDVRSDVNGVEATRFGARTSGHVVVFDTSGRERFSGGITPARGHAGENLGRNSVIRLLMKGNTAVRSTSVFGCPLFNPEER